MTPELKASLMLLVFIGASTVNAAQNQPRPVEIYRPQGVAQSDPEQGQRLWYAEVNSRSCSSCHGNDPRGNGKHIKTGKLIQPMALSVNPERYQNAKKIEKWFLRNCKWTFGRECKVQEKADLLAWLSSL